MNIKFEQKAWTEQIQLFFFASLDAGAIDRNGQARNLSRAPQPDELQRLQGRDPKALPKRGKRQQEITTEWDKVIADAERRIERLRLAVKTCREMKAAGEPWPGKDGK